MVWVTGGVAAVAEAEQQQLHAGLEHLADRPSGEAHTVRGPSRMGPWYYFGKLKDPLEGLVPGPTRSEPCPRSEPRLGCEPFPDSEPLLGSTPFPGCEPYPGSTPYSGSTPFPGTPSSPRPGSSPPGGSVADRVTGCPGLSTATRVARPAV